MHVHITLLILGFFALKASRFSVLSPIRIVFFGGGGDAGISLTIGSKGRTVKRRFRYAF
jgi:hypothetical protein